MVINIAFGIFLTLSTVFMVFLRWLSKGSQDQLARKLRMFGYTMTTFGWIGLAIRLLCF
jgi:hypothetical protein